MIVNQILGWIGNALFFSGVYALGKKNAMGFYFNAIANLLYAIQSVRMNNISLFWLSLGLMVLNLIGVIRWANLGDKNV